MTVRLAFDSSTPRASVALLQDDQVLAETRLQSVGGRHNDHLLAQAEALLACCGYAARDIDELVVVQGPGSFTGLRVGLATVQGLALSLKRPIRAVDSLRALAFQHGPCERPLCALIDARKQEVYAALYCWRPGQPLSYVTPRVLPPAQLAYQLPEDVLLLGDAARFYGEALATAGVRQCFAGLACGGPTAAAAALLVHAQPDDFALLTAACLRALYVRASDAERARQPR